MTVLDRNRPRTEKERISRKYARAASVLFRPTRPKSSKINQTLFCETSVVR